MICPNCRDDVTPVAYVGQVTVCPSCKRSIVQEAYGFRVARAEDTLSLLPSEIAQLRKLRQRKGARA